MNHVLRVERREASIRVHVHGSAERLGVPKRAVRIVAGETSRAKVMEIDGTTESAIRALAANTNDKS